jgi:hypothetical protein
MPTFERRMTSSTRAQDVAQCNVDRELVARAQAGDAVAFELLVVKYQRRVAALVRSLVRRADITEELTQEVFINAYDHLADLRAGGHPTDPRNLWPRRVEGDWNAKVKDQFEAAVCLRLCRGELTLEAGRAMFLEPDWREAYLRMFRVE